MLKKGDMVKVLYPFTDAFPLVYEIKKVKENGVCVICEDRDFDPIFLEDINKPPVILD